MDFKQLLTEKLDKNSDKVSKHGYHEVYADKLPQKINMLVEVGIAIDGKNTSSLNSWSEIYPDAKIIGLDNVESKLINSENIKSYLVDQSSARDLEKFVEELKGSPDVIIDDGSHDPDHFLLTFSILFPILKKNGVYFIEDVWSGDTLEKSKKYLEGYKGIEFKIHDRTNTNYPDSIIIEIKRNA